MAETFNLNSFLQTYKHSTYDPTKQHTAAEENMEQQLVQKAEEAVKGNGLLSLTLSEKMAELGIGDRVLEQIGETAANIVLDIPVICSHSNRVCTSPLYVTLRVHLLL